MESVVQPPDRLLIVGPMRSGSTYLANVLARTQGTSFLNEPDTPLHTLVGCRAIRGLGTQPALTVDDDHPALRQLFDSAFSGSTSSIDRIRRRIGEGLAAPFIESRSDWCADPELPPLPLRLRLALAVTPFRIRAPSPTPVRLVKSVMMPLSIDWIVERLSPRLVLTRRHPLDVVASWQSLGIDPVGRGWHMLVRGDLGEVAARFGAPPPPADSVDCRSTAARAWVVGLLMSGIERAAIDHPGAVVVDHEQVCVDPLTELQRVAEDLGLRWTDEAADFVRSRNRPGEGWATYRVASSLPGSWRRRLSADDVRDAVAVLREFPWANRYEGLDQVRRSFHGAT